MLAAGIQYTVTEAQKLADAAGGERIPMAAVRTNVMDLKAAVLTGECEAVCPFCEGAACDECNQLGWMNADVYGGLPQEMK